jgi:hypothetical protein
MRLQRALKKASGRKKGLLVANAKAHCEVYGTDIITGSELDDLRHSIASDEERRSYNMIRGAEHVLSAHIWNAQTRYFQLREQLALLAGLFMLFRQQVSFEEILNELSWGKTTASRALRERIGSRARAGLFGVFGLREEDGYSFVDIAVSEEGMKLARVWISSATELMVTVKTMAEAAREFMEAHDVHLTAYEDLLNGWEGELRELIRVTKCRLLPVDFEGWEEIRELYVQSGEERLELVEALPEYESIAFDEASLDEMLASLDRDFNNS